MSLTDAQKKKLLIGGGVGALAFFFGSALFGGRKAGTDVSVGQRPQQLTFPKPRRENPGDPIEGPGAPIWRLNDRIHGFVFEFGNVMSSSAQLWAALHPVWEREVLPFLTEWGPFWRDSSRWSWSEFDRWATRWNAIVARTSTMLPSKERGRGQ